MRTIVDTIEPATITSTERDQLKISFLQFDVTGKVLNGATAALRKILLPRMDRQLAMLDVRTPLEKIWVELQQPIRITDSLWLILQPSGVHWEGSGLEGDGGRANRRHRRATAPGRPQCRSSPRCRSRPSVRSRMSRDSRC